MSTTYGGNSMYGGPTSPTPNRDPAGNRGYYDGGGQYSPSPMDRTNRSDLTYSPGGNNVAVTRRIVEPDRTYLDTLKKTIEDNMNEEQRLRMEKEQLLRENTTIQQQLGQTNFNAEGDPSYESNIQRNAMLKAEITDLQKRLERERDLQKKSLNYQEGRLREYEEKIRGFEVENNQLRTSLNHSSDKDGQLRQLAAENQRLKEELFKSNDGSKIDTVRIVQENAQLKSKISELEREVQMLRMEKERIEKNSQGGNKSDKLMKELRKLNEDNVTLYDDNKLLLRQNQMLKNELEQIKKGGGHTHSQLITSSNITTTVIQETPAQKRLQDNVNNLTLENRNLMNELSAIKSRMNSDAKTINNDQQMSRMQADMVVREREIADLKNRNQKLEAELSLNDRELSDFRARFPRIESDYRRVQAELTSTSQRLQEQNDKIRMMNMDISQKEEELRLAVQSQNAPNPQVQQIQLVIKQRDEEIRSLNQSKFNTESRINQAETEARTLRGNLESIKSQLNNALQDQNGAAIEINKLRKRIQEMEFERESLMRKGNSTEDAQRKSEMLEKELDRKVQREKRIETELTKLRTEIEIVINERDSLKKYKENDTNREMVTQLERENNDLRRRAGDTSQLSQLNNEIMLRDRKINELASINQRLEREVEDVREKSRQLIGGQSNNKELENKINYLMSENSKLKYDLENLQKVEESSYKTKYLIDDLNRKLGNLEIDKERTEQSLKNALAELKSSEDTRRMERQELEESRLNSRKLQDKVYQLDNEKGQALRNSIREDHLSNQPHIDSLKNENKSLLDRLTNTKEETIRLRQEVQEREAQMNRLGLDLQKRDFELKTLAYEKERLLAEVDQLNRHKDKFKDAGMMEDRMHNIKNEVNTLHEKIIELERANLDKDTEIANLRREQPNKFASEDLQSGQRLIYQTQLLELKQEISSLNSKMLMLRQENENLSRIAKERLIELENIKSEELTRLRKQFESYVRQHYDIQELTARHEIELRKYQNKISELLQTVTQLQEKNRELRTALSQRNALIESLSKPTETLIMESTMTRVNETSSRQEREIFRKDGEYLGKRNEDFIIKFRKTHGGAFELLNHETGEVISESHIRFSTEGLKPTKPSRPQIPSSNHRAREELRNPRPLPALPPEDPSSRQTHPRHTVKEATEENCSPNRLQHRQGRLLEEHVDRRR